MAALTRSALEQSPLADLHALASELGLDGYRRLRKAELVDALLASQGADDGGQFEPETELDLELETDEETDAPSERPARSRTRSRGGRGRAARGQSDDAAQNGSDTPREERIVEGVIELLANGSGFLRLTPPDASDDDVYVSAAQVRRCELVNGDLVSGPMRSPRRSERYPSLVRVDTIDGKPADEVAEGTRFEDLPCTYASEPFVLGADKDLAAIDSVAPLGKGSRVAIHGATQAGKSQLLRRIAVALKDAGEDIDVVLAGVRPEEPADWAATGIDPAGVVALTASAEAQTQAITAALDTAKRVVARGGDRVVLIDTLDGIGQTAARRALGLARNVVDGGSLTVIATAVAPVGGETTLIALDAAQARGGTFPAIDAAASGTLRADLLVR